MTERTLAEAFQDFNKRDAMMREMAALVDKHPRESLNVIRFWMSQQERDLKAALEEVRSDNRYSP